MVRVYMFVIKTNLFKHLKIHILNYTYTSVNFMYSNVMNTKNLDSNIVHNVYTGVP